MAVESQRPGASPLWRNPPAMTSALPTVGNSAAVPGYGVDVSSAMPAKAISPSPTQAATAAGLSGIRASWVAPIARNAPRPSSHARVRREKNAHGAFASVSQMATPNETRTMTPATIAIQRAKSARPRANRTTRSTIAGQKK